MSDRPRGRPNGRRGIRIRDASGAALSILLESAALLTLVLIGLALAAVVLAIT